MELTKLEKAIVISGFVQGVGEEVLNNNESKLLTQLNDELANILSNSTLSQMQEAGESVLNKLIQSLFEKEQSPPLTK
ncbi:hypothetical protein [Bacillus sp. C30]|uniref:hypothetical protein n=1 Tax=Bacillus sp. C30 TaxID=1387733 RepID=UPI00349F7C6B